MQHCSDFSCGCLKDICVTQDRCKPCDGYIVERIRHCDHEHLSFHGMLELRGLPPDLKPPLSLCAVNVVCIVPQQTQSPCCACNQMAFRLSLRCLVMDSCGTKAWTQTCMMISLRQLAGLRAGNLRLGASVEIKDAQYCPPCAFFVCASVQVFMVISGNARILSQCSELKPSSFLPLYPEPVRDHAKKSKLFSGFDR